MASRQVGSLDRLRTGGFQPGFTGRQACNPWDTPHWSDTSDNPAPCCRLRSHGGDPARTPLGCGSDPAPASCHLHNALGNVGNGSALVKPKSTGSQALHDCPGRSRSIPRRGPAHVLEHNGRANDALYAVGSPRSHVFLCAMQREFLAISLHLFGHGLNLVRFRIRAKRFVLHKHFACWHGSRSVVLRDRPKPTVGWEGRHATDRNAKTKASDATQVPVNMCGVLPRPFPNATAVEWLRAAQTQRGLCVAQ